LEIVLRDAVSEFIYHTKIELSACVSLLGQRSPLTQGCGVVATVIGIFASLIIRPGRSARNTIDSTTAMGNGSDMSMRASQRDQL
jgi:hypothetical protein